MSKFGIIAFIAFIVIQIVGGLAQSQQKRKQQEAMRQKLAGRRGGTPAVEATAGGREAMTPSQVPSRAEASVGGGPESASTARLDDLAVRRRAQLAELRRRAQRVTGSGTGSVGPTGAAPAQPMAEMVATPKPAPPQASPAASTSVSGSDLWAQEELARTEATEQRRRAAREREQRDERWRTERERSRTQRERERLARSRERELHERERDIRQRPNEREAAAGEPDAYVIRARGNVRRAQLSVLLKNRHSVRDAIMLAELLAPPVSLRS